MNRFEYIVVWDSMGLRSVGEQATADIVKSHGSDSCLYQAQVMLLVFLHVFAGFMASQKGLQVRGSVRKEKQDTNHFGVRVPTAFDVLTVVAHRLFPNLGCQVDAGQVCSLIPFKMEKTWPKGTEHSQNQCLIKRHLQIMRTLFANMRRVPPMYELRL